MKVLLVVVSGLLLACAPEKRLPAEPESLTEDQQLQQTEDVGSLRLDVFADLVQLIAAGKTNVVKPPPQPRRIAKAWLEPSPSEHNFTHENPFWQTFTVRAVSGVDSVYVLANPQMDGVDRALETASGREPPFRNFCPASWNDHPGRGRINGWPLHLSACAKGTTYLILYGWRQGKLDLYNIYPITIK